MQGFLKYYMKEAKRILLFAILFAFFSNACKKQNNTNPSSIAIAWVLSRQGITAPISSATSVEQLNELIKATEINLDAAAVELLNKASAY